MNAETASSPETCEALAIQALTCGESCADIIRWLGTAATAGRAKAQYLLGLLHMRGLHSAACDPSLAAHWCSAAAAQGYGPAQFNLGLLHVCGQGVAIDAAVAERWFRIAAASGLADAEVCLDLIYDADDGHPRPRTWDEAETRASVVLERSDPETRKSLRFSEYYVDPCINHLINRCHLAREKSEEIVQQFMLELEEPLTKGVHRGRAWKDSLREHFTTSGDARTKRFRPFLGRVLENFARDCLRRERAPARTAPVAQPSPDPLVVVEHHREAWQAILDRFAVEAAASHPSAERVCAALILMLTEDADQTTVMQRLNISERTVRNHRRQAGELLLVWLKQILNESGLHDPAIDEGLAVLPQWLHRMTPAGRARALLFLALVHLRLESRPPD